MIVLFDFNLTGYVVLFQGTLAAEGWVEIASRILMRSQLYIVILCYY